MSSGGNPSGKRQIQDSANGHLVFDYYAQAPIWTAPALRPDGSIVIADRNGRVMLLGEG